MPFDPAERDRDLCHVIVEAHRYIEIYLNGVDESAFRLQHMLQDAVIMRLQQVLECSGKLSARTQAGLKIDWSSLVAMRNKISHAYDEVDIKLVWQVIREFEEFKKLIEFAQSK